MGSKSKAKAAKKPEAKKEETKSKVVNFNTGDEVYFSKYTRKVHQKFLKPGSVYYVGEAVEIDGEPGFALTDKKGEFKDNALASELKMKRAANTVKKDAEAKAEQKAKAAAERPKKERLTKEKAKKVVQSDEERAAALAERLDSRFEEKEQKAKLDLLQGLQFGLTDDLSRQLQDEGKDPLELARETYGVSQNAHFQLGGILAYIFTEDLYKTRYGYNRANGGFNAFINQNMPGMEWRKGRQLMDIYLTFTTYGIPESVVEELGWTICAQIAATKNEQSIRELIEFMRTPNEHGIRPNSKQLAAEIKMNYTSRTGTTEEEVELSAGVKTKFKHQTFSFTESDFPVVQEALNQLKVQYPDYADNEAKLLFMLCSEYVANVQAEQGAITEEAFIRHGQNMFQGKEIFIRDTKSGRVSNPAYNEGQVTMHVAKAQEQEVEKEAVTA